MRHSKEDILLFKAYLDEHGFKTNWKDPFFSWVHKTHGDDKLPEDPDRFFVELPIKTSDRAPYDFADIMLVFDQDVVRFELTFYFNTFMEELSEADDFKHAIQKHDDLWFPALRDCLEDVERQFRLEWETRYDTTIEDCLHGSFGNDGLQKIANLTASVYKIFEAGLK
jgi:hypothetical protein